MTLLLGVFIAMIALVGSLGYLAASVKDATTGSALGVIIFLFFLQAVHTEVRYWDAVEADERQWNHAVRAFEQKGD